MRSSNRFVTLPRSIQLLTVSYRFLPYFLGFEQMSRSSRKNPFAQCKWLLSRVRNLLTGKYHLHKGEKINRFQVFLRLQRSVFPVILPWVLFYSIWGFLVTLLYNCGLHIGFPDRLITDTVLSFNIGLTLLLVFRTNTAHERFWEGRKLWGSLVNTVRNLARDIWIVVKEQGYEARAEKEATLRLVAAFAVALKLHLRAEPVNEELASLMSSTEYLKLKELNHPPLQIAYWITEYLQYQHDCNCLNIYQLTALQKLVDDLVNVLGGCERILKTPLPLIYSVIFKQLVLIYCLLLPLQMVEDFYWWTGLITALVSFTLLSIEEVGAEIEEPFGYDANDLPLDMICNTMLSNVEELIRLAPSHQRFYRK